MEHALGIYPVVKAPSGGLLGTGHRGLVAGDKTLECSPEEQGYDETVKPGVKGED